MKNISFSIFKDNSIQTISSQDLLTNKRVLICSAVRAAESLTHSYIGSIVEQQQLYKNYGIDEICLVYPNGGLFFIARAIINYKSLTALHDVDQSFLKYMAQLNNKTESINTLAMSWSYQALFNNGKLEFFVEQPTTNNIKHLISYLLQHKDVDGGRLLWKFKNNHKEYLDPLQESLLFTKQVLTAFETTQKNGKLIFYYNLWPNTQLEKYLIDTTSTI